MPESSERTWWRWLLLPLTVVVVGVGVWVTGGLVTDDELVAKALTAGWFAVAGVIALVVGWRQRSVAAPVLIGYGVGVAAMGGFLLYTSTVDRVVDEDVVAVGEANIPPDVQESPSSGGSEGNESGDDAEGNVLLARGSFTDGEHPTDGIASVVMTPERDVLTLTMFATDPGPDLRVYLVPAGTDVGKGLDLGGLKGNKGDQQYELPGSVSRQSLQDASVVIWCRAFSVAFGTAQLRT